MYNNNDLEEYNSLLTEKNIESLKSGIDLLIYNSDETKVDTLRDNNDIITTKFGNLLWLSNKAFFAKKNVLINLKYWKDLIQ